MKSRKTYRACASVIVLRPGPHEKHCEVLLVHKPRRRDAWQTPQGGIERGETLEEAGKRELKEETGISIQGNIIACPQVYQYDYPARFIRAENPRYRGQRLLFIAATTSRQTGVSVDNRELDGYKWVQPKDLWQYLNRKQYLKCVQAAVLSAQAKLKV